MVELPHFLLHNTSNPSEQLYMLEEVFVYFIIIIFIIISPPPPVVITLGGRYLTPLLWGSRVSVDVGRGGQRLFLGCPVGALDKHSPTLCWMCVHGNTEAHKHDPAAGDHHLC